jgi:hypothetical protein
MNRMILLASAFALLLCAAARPATAQWCAHIEGMSVCDPEYPGTWADCVAQSHLSDCLADPNSYADECWAEYPLVWYMEYNSASRDCGLIRQECELIGGWINRNGGCSRYLAGGGGGGGGYGDGGGGGGSDGWGNGGLECHTERVELQVQVGGEWITIWEGSAEVCEAAT